MANVVVKNGDVILKDRVLRGASVAVSGSKITFVGRSLSVGKGSFLIDAKGCFVSPGFIDCHIHGDPEKIFFNEGRYGLTAFVVAESCAPLDFIYKRAGRIKEYMESNPLGGNVLGMRIEGPYISKEKAGAQNPFYIRRPDAKELSGILRKLKGILKIMTIAPELEGARPILSILRKNGVIASIGHSAATYEKAAEGIDAGIRHATHTFNAMSGIDRREPGVAGAVLMDERVTAEVILDLVHVHKALFELLLKVKRKDKVIIVSDSLTSGEPQDVLKVGGAYRFEDGRLAGSSLTMINALKNAVTKCGMPLLDAIRLITLNPARLLGVEKSKGSIKKGKDADIVVFDKEFNVKATIIRGKMIYKI